jgi:Holliday junction resolvase
MSSPQKDKGDRAEREISELLTELTGLPVRRKLGAGRKDDEGDLEGLPDITVQVAAWKDTLAAVRTKPLEAEQQRLNAGTSLVVTLVKLNRAGWRAVMTPEQLAAWIGRLR